MIVAEQGGAQQGSSSILSAEWIGSFRTESFFSYSSTIPSFLASLSPEVTVMSSPPTLRVPVDAVSSIYPQLSIDRGLWRGLLPQILDPSGDKPSRYPEKSTPISPATSVPTHAANSATTPFSELESKWSPSAQPTRRDAGTVRG